MPTRFHDLLGELGKQLDLELIPDMRNACTLLYKKSLFVQMEIDAWEKYFLLACRVAELPPGKFRENVLTAALKSNDLFPLIASFGYSSKYNALTLSASLFLEGLSGKDLFSFLASFIQTAESWKKSIENGQSSPPEMQFKKT